MSRKLATLLFATAAWSALCGTSVLAQEKQAQPPAPQPTYAQAKAAHAWAAQRKAELEKAAKSKPAQPKPALAMKVPAEPEQPRLELPVADDDGSAGLSGAPAQHDLDTLHERYRPSIHPGEALTIHGNEEDGNDLRARTPLLANGEHEPLQVDTDAAYQRALAMYGEGRTFHAPLPRPSSTSEPAPGPELESEPAAALDAPKERGPEAAPWSVLAGLLVSAALIVWFLVRVRPALSAPKEMREPEAKPFIWNPSRRSATPVRSPYAEPVAALPQRPQAVSNGTRMAAKPRQR